MSTVFVIASTTIKFAPYIASFLGLTESVSSKLDRTISMHLHSAFLNLEHAKRTEDSAIANDYLKRAKDKFIDAIGIETDNNKLITAYSGLAFCQGLLRDGSNMKFNLNRAYDLYREQVSQITTRQQLFRSSMRSAFDDCSSFKSSLFHSGVASYGAVTTMQKKDHIIKILPVICEIEKTGYVNEISKDYLRSL